MRAIDVVSCRVHKKDAGLTMIYILSKKSMLIVENGNNFFLTSAASPYPLTLEFIELVLS